MTRTSLVSLLLALGGTLGTPMIAASQQITCVQPSGCTLKATSDTATQYLTVRVSGVPLGTPVRFERKEGAGNLTSQVSTDVNGIATTKWEPAPGSPYPARIEVSVSTAAGTANRTLQITYTAPEAPMALIPATNSGNNQWWYEDRQLRAPVRVEIRGPTSAAECESTLVTFRAVGGTAAPDTANGTWEGRSSEQCIAESWWQLPKVVGTNALRATLSNGSNVTFLGHARRLPRVVIGVAAYRTHSFSSLTSTADTIKVERALPGTTTTITYDSVTTVSKVKETAGTEAFNPVIGVDFPIHPQLQRVRMSLLTTMTHPDENLFVGVSLPQLVRGVGQEAVGFDFHLTLHIERLNTLRDRSACEAAPTDASKCGDHHVLRYGIGFVGITDTTDLVSTLGSIFGIK